MQTSGTEAAWESLRKVVSIGQGVQGSEGGE